MPLLRPSAEPLTGRSGGRACQFGAFCPLFRLHGHRGGAAAKANPPTQCRETNGDNEVWNLARDPEHYDAIVAVMELRETLRDYVAEINNQTVMSGVPMMRPMMLEFPADRECYTKPAENQVRPLAQPAMSGQRCLACDDARHGADSLQPAVF